MMASLENGTLGKNWRFEERTECKRLSPGYEPGPAFSLYYSASIKSVLSKPFPKCQILDSSKLKQFADDNFKFNENGRKSLNQVENTMGKGEIACDDVFQKTCNEDM